MLSLSDFIALTVQGRRDFNREPASFDNKCHLKQLSKRSERACMRSEILLKYVRDNLGCESNEGSKVG